MNGLPLLTDAQRLIYHLPKPSMDGQTQIILSPLELIGRIAALVPPPRQHRHRYYGVLAPNSPLRPAVTALAPHPEAPVPETKPAAETAADDPPAAIGRSPARYLCSSHPWDSPPSMGACAKIRSRRIFGSCCWPASTRHLVAPSLGLTLVHEGLRENSLPANFSFDLPSMRGRDADHRLYCPEAVDVRAILEPIGEPATPPRIASARGPPEWYEDSGEEAIDAFDHLQGDPIAQPEPEYEYDQRVSW